jgi:hypothetical protein
MPISVVKERKAYRQQFIRGFFLARRPQNSSTFYLKEFIPSHSPVPLSQVGGDFTGR